MLLAKIIFYHLGTLPRNAPEISEITSSTTKIKNIILAIPAAAPAMPPKPNTAAISAITKNVIVQRNIVSPWFINLFRYN